MSSTTITRGNSHETFYITPSLTPTVLSANVGAVQTFSVPGLQTTDIVVCLGYNGNQTNGIIVAEADCLTANILSVQFANCTTASATPAVGTYTIQVTRLEGPAPTTAV